MGPNFESLTVRALGLATLKKILQAGQLTLGSYFSDLDLRYKISSQGQLPSLEYFLSAVLGAIRSATKPRRISAARGFLGNRNGRV